MTLPSASLYPELTDTQSQSFKICKVCFRRLPTTQFEKANHGTTFRGDCRECRLKRKKMSAAEKQATSPPLVAKICVRCGIEKPIAEFTRVSSNTSGFHSYCKECKRAGEQARATKKAEQTKQKLRLEYEQMDSSLVPLAKMCGNQYCSLAGIVQPPENFDKSKLHTTGLRIDCRLCELERKRSNPKEASKEYHNRWYQEHKEELNKRTKEWRNANPDEVRRLHIERRFRQYGVTQEWYDATLAAQGGGCAICGSHDPKTKWNTFHVDHDHSCCSKSCHACDNCRRGLLCNPCNLKLAHLENAAWKRNAIAYLNKYRRKDAYGNDQPSLFT